MRQGAGTPQDHAFPGQKLTANVDSDTQACHGDFVSHFAAVDVGVPPASEARSPSESGRSVIASQGQHDGVGLLDQDGQWVFAAGAASQGDGRFVGNEQKPQFRSDLLRNSLDPTGRHEERDAPRSRDELMGGVLQAVSGSDHDSFSSDSGSGSMKGRDPAGGLSRTGRARASCHHYPNLEQHCDRVRGRCRHEIRCCDQDWHYGRTSGGVRGVYWGVDSTRQTHRDRGRNRGSDRDRDRGRDRDREKDLDWDLDRDRGTHRDRDRDMERDRDRNGHRGRDRHWDRDKDRGRDRDGNGDWPLHKLISKQASYLKRHRHGYRGRPTDANGDMEPLVDSDRSPAGDRTKGGGGLPDQERQAKCSPFTSVASVGASITILTDVYGVPVGTSGTITGITGLNRGPVWCVKCNACSKSTNQIAVYSEHEGRYWACHASASVGAVVHITVGSHGVVAGTFGTIDAEGRNKQTWTASTSNGRKLSLPKKNEGTVWVCLGDVRVSPWLLGALAPPSGNGQKPNGKRLTKSQSRFYERVLKQLRGLALELPSVPRRWEDGVAFGCLPKCTPTSEFILWCIRVCKQVLEDVKLPFPKANNWPELRAEWRTIALLNVPASAWREVGVFGQVQAARAMVDRDETGPVGQGTRKRKRFEQDLAEFEVPMSEEIDPVFLASS